MEPIKLSVECDKGVRHTSFRGRENALKEFASMMEARTSRAHEQARTTEAKGLTSDIFMSISGLNYSLIGECSKMMSADKLLALLANDPSTLCIFPSLDIFYGNMQDLSTLASGGWLSRQRTPLVQGSSPSSQMASVNADVSSSETLIPPGIPLYIEQQMKEDDSLEEIISLEQSIQHHGASNLSEPISWTRSSSPYAPVAMLQSFSHSFTSILESRLKACILLLLNHTLTSRQERISQLATFLLDTETIRLQSITISYEALSPTSEQQKTPLSSSDYCLNNKDTLVLPLRLDALIVAKVLKETIDVKLTAAGSIKGTFNDSTTSALNRVDVSLDTSSLMSSMVEAAKRIIAKAVNTFAGRLMTKFSSGQDVYFSAKLPRQVETYDPLEETVKELPISLASMTLLSVIKDRVSSTPTSDTYSVASSSESCREKLKSKSCSRMPATTRRHSDAITYLFSMKKSSENLAEKSWRRYSTPEARLFSSISVGKPIASLLNSSNRNATFLESGIHQGERHHGIKRWDSCPEDRSSNLQSRTPLTPQRRCSKNRSMRGRSEKKTDSCIDVPLLIPRGNSTCSINTNGNSYASSSSSLGSRCLPPLRNDSNIVYNTFVERHQISPPLESLLHCSSPGSL